MHCSLRFLEIYGSGPHPPGPYYGAGTLLLNLDEVFSVTHDPGAYFKSTLLQEHIANMPLMQCAFQIWTWSIFDLEYSFRLLMVQHHMVLDHIVLSHYGSETQVETKISEKRCFKWGLLQ